MVERGEKYLPGVNLAPVTAGCFLRHGTCYVVGRGRHTKTTQLLIVLAVLAAGGCADPGDDDGGLDARSRSVGERNERLGNDPAEQNTGEGSNPENEPPPRGVPQQ
jgi:hypothetical protein